MTSHYNGGFVTMLLYYDFGGALGSLGTLSFGPSQFHGHTSRFVCEAMIGENRQLVTDEPVKV